MWTGWHGEHRRKECVWSSTNRRPLWEGERPTTTRVPSRAPRGGPATTPRGPRRRRRRTAGLAVRPKPERAKTRGRGQRRKTTRGRPVQDPVDDQTRGENRQGRARRLDGVPAQRCKDDDAMPVCPFPQAVEQGEEDRRICSVTDRALKDAQSRERLRVCSASADGGEGTVSEEGVTSDNESRGAAGVSPKRRGS